MSFDNITLDHGVNSSVVDLQADNNITIHKAVKNRDNPYAQIRKDILNNQKLSWEAKGLMAYLLGLRDDWVIHLSELVCHSSNGRDKTYSIVRELINSGYMVKTRERRLNGTWTPYKYIVYEVPISIEPPLTGIPYVEQSGTSISVEPPLTEPPLTGIPSLTNKDLRDTDIENNNNKEPVVVCLEEVKELYKKVWSYGIIQGTFENWIAKYGLDYVSEKVTLMLSKPRTSAAGFLNSAILHNWQPIKQIPEKQEAHKAISASAKEFTRDENLVWFAGLVPEVKEKILADAQFKHIMLPTDIAPGDKNHDAWFGPFMEIMGRKECST